MIPRVTRVQRAFHQHASDTFTVKVVPGTKHCGIDDTHSTFRFSVDIDYTDSALDSHDFLIDNTYFRQYFNSLEPVCVSCERLAANSVDHFLTVLREKIDSVRRVAVRIYPFGDVYVESIATNDEERIGDNPDASTFAARALQFNTTLDNSAVLEPVL